MADSSLDAMPVTLPLSQPTTMDLSAAPSKATLRDKEENEKAELPLVPSLPLKEGQRHDWVFWCIVFSLFVPTLLTAVELTAIGTALPVIVEDLQGSQFVWVGSAYTLGSTALLPLSGGLAQILGRRVIMLSALALFSIGSAICGAATSLPFLICGRAVQGLGGGGITALVQIILADLLSLRERSTFNGLMAMAWAIGGGAGPVIGGALAQAGHWRWLFYMNIPVCGVAAVLIALCLRLRVPKVDVREQLLKMDWLGNALLVASSTSVVVALSWGGVEYVWASARVLVSLLLGLLGLAVFAVHEVYFAQNPIVPGFLVADRTALSGYVQNFIMGIPFAALAYWLPVYFQACKGASPMRSGVDGFGLSFTSAPMAIIAGAIVTRTGRYRVQTWAAWALVLLGLGLPSSLRVGDGPARAYGSEILAGVGLGVVYVTVYFPVLSALPVTASTPALAFHVFLRNFSQIWGVTVAGSVLQNQLRARLPQAFVSLFPHGAEVAYAAIPLVPGLAQPLRDEVRAAFARALGVVWAVMLGVAALGLLASLVMRELPLHTTTDKDWGRDERRHAEEGADGA